MNSVRRLTAVACLLLFISCKPQQTVMPVNVPKAVPDNAGLGQHLDLKVTPGFAAFKEMNQATLAPQADELAITASGTDPSIALPQFGITPPVRFAVRIDLTVPANTLAELFYTTNAVPSFSADHVISVPVKVGRNLIVFEINDPEFAGNLRFDPGQVAGQYILHAGEVFCSGPISIAKPSVPANSTPNSTP